MMYTLAVLECIESFVAGRSYLGHQSSVTRISPLDVQLSLCRLTHCSIRQIGRYVYLAVFHYHAGTLLDIILFFKALS